MGRVFSRAVRRKQRFADQSDDLDDALVEAQQISGLGSQKTSDFDDDWDDEEEVEEEFEEEFDDDFENDDDDYDDSDDDDDDYNADDDDDDDVELEDLYPPSFGSSNSDLYPPPTSRDAPPLRISENDDWLL